MANTRIVERYSNLLKRLFPEGWAWNHSENTPFDLLIKSMAVEPCRFEERAYEFIEEMDPRQTFELLEDWERLLGLPDECSRDDPDNPIGLSERRNRIVQALTANGGQSREFYLYLIETLGYDIEADNIEIVEFQAFRAGISRVGDRLTNTDAWAYTWQVFAPAAITRCFRVGKSTVGERLKLLENEELECLLTKFKPAHTKVIFSFGA